MRQSVTQMGKNTCHQLLEPLENRQLMAFAMDSGFAATGIYSAAKQSYTAIAKGSSGSLWIGGTTRGSPFITKLTAQGIPDTSFHGGKALLFGSAGQSVKQIVELSSGKIEVNLQSSIFRFSNSGTLDSGFGNSGFTKIKNNRSVSIDTNGAFYAAGNSTIAKYTANGAIDTTWGKSGVYDFTKAPGISALLTEIQATQFIVSPGANGRAMLCISNGQEMPKFGVLRLTTTGTLNTTFAGDGTYITAATVDTKSLTDFIALPDSQSMLLIDRDDGRTEVLALDGKGAPKAASVDSTDPSKNNQFRFAGGLSTVDQATALGLGANGTILLLGGFNDFYSDSRFSGGIARINPDFTLDRTTAADADGIIATRVLPDDAENPDYTGQPIIRAFQPDSNTIFAITSNGDSNAIIKLSSLATSSKLSISGNRIIINSTNSADDIAITGDTNKINVSINGDYFKAPTTPLSQIELSSLGGDDDINVSGSFPADSITINTKNGSDYVNITHAETQINIKIILGTGADTAYTDQPATINGDEGDDQIQGAGPSAALFGGDGNDAISSDVGNDYLEGNAGNDTLNGGAGNDRLVGGDGNDLLLGGAQRDTLYGEAGNDTLKGGAHADYLDGGPDSDMAIYDSLDTLKNIELI